MRPASNADLVRVSYFFGCYQFPAIFVVFSIIDLRFLSDWAGKDGYWVKNTHTLSFEINNKSKEKKEVLDTLIRSHYNLDKPLYFPLMFKQLKKKR